MITLLNNTVRVKLENWQGQSCIIEVGIREGQYTHEGAWVAYRRYRGGLNRLSDDRYEYFDSKQDAVNHAKRWL